MSINPLSLFVNRGGLYWTFNLDNEYQNEIINKIYYAEKNHKIYLFDHSFYEEDGCDILEIKVIGSLNKKKGNNYREQHIVKLNTIVEDVFCTGSRFTCSCKDFLYRSEQYDIVCKHIVFILCKIGGIYDKEYFKTKILTAHQTEYIFNLMKNERLWRNINVSIKYLNDDFKNMRELEQDETCTICFDDLKNRDTISCPECFNIVHETCMKKWLDINKSCVHCRSDKWVSYDKETIDCKIIKNEF